MLDLNIASVVYGGWRVELMMLWLWLLFLFFSLSNSPTLLINSPRIREKLCYFPLAMIYNHTIAKESKVRIGGWIPPIQKVFKKTKKKGTGGKRDFFFFFFALKVSCSRLEIGDPTEPREYRLRASAQRQVFGLLKFRVQTLI